MTDAVAVDAPAGDTRQRALVVAGAVLVALTPIISHSFGRNTYGLLLPAIEDTLRLDHSQTGLGGTVIFAAYLLGVIVVAALSRRCEPIAIMRGGVAIVIAGLVWMSTVDSLGGLMFGLFLTGGAGAGLWITAPAILTSTVGPQRRGLVIGLLTATIGLASFFVGMATNAARHASGDELLWRPIWLGEAAVSAVLLVGLVLLARPPRTPRSQAGTFDLDRLRGLPSWRRVTVAYSLFGAVGAGFSPFLVRSLQSDAGLSKAGASSVYSAMALLSIPGAPGLGWLSDRWGRKPVMAAVLAIAAVGTGTVSLGHGAVAVAGVFCYGSVWSSYPTLVATYVRDHTEARGFNEAFSTMTIFYSLAALCAPVLIGWVADRTGHFRTPYLGLTVLCAFAALLMARLPTGSATTRPNPAPA